MGVPKISYYQNAAGAQKSLPKLSTMWQKNGQKTIPSSVEIASSKGCRLLVIEQMYCDSSNILLSSILYLMFAFGNISGA